MFQRALILFVVVTTFSCVKPPEVEGPREGVFGAALTLSDTVALDKVLAAPEAYSEKPVLVTGMVRKACSKRGCWMELASTMDAAAPGCRVTFKDYGFFVPLDAAGSSARVQGLVQVRELPAAEVEHMEAEGARFPSKNEDGSANEVRIVATGVELKRG